jgi:two-component system nitrogen regulation response regulator GlnG
MKPVWIIDDDRSIRWVLEKSLTREDIEFKSFSSADDAMRALSNEEPQVVVPDWIFCRCCTSAIRLFRSLS